MTADASGAKPRIRVAVLGGGAGALSTVFALTDPNNPNRDRYDITVYQLGWRLGGKGASGRNAAEHQRIEEHGLHIWFGFYDNAFRLIRRCYDELGRPSGTPLARWDDAFKPHNFGGTAEIIDGKWVNWPIAPPPNAAEPGGDTLLLAPWEYLIMALEAIHDIVTGARPTPSGVEHIHTEGPAFVKLDSLFGTVEEVVLRAGVEFLKGVLKLAHSIAPNRHGPHHDLLLCFLQQIMALVWDRIGPRIHGTSAGALQERRRWIVLNLFYAHLHGAIAGRVLERGLDSLNHRDYLDWLSEHAYPDGGVMASSALPRASYYGVFGFENGDPAKPNFEAGTAVRLMLRSMLTYRGAFSWKMQAGMGDTIFAPMYEMLRRRGVRFEFFQRVRDVYASADGSIVEHVRIGVQATLKTDQTRYDPFVDVKGLPCWPSTPRYEQLVQGEAIRERSIDLEDYCADWPDVEERILERGRDFDVVVLGISLGALPYICSDLIQKNTRWKQMVDNVRTVRTQACQLWLSKTTRELGWKLGGAPVLSWGVSTLCTWGDMTHLLEREAWSGDSDPLSLAYFCGAMQDDPPLIITPDGPKEDCAARNQDTARQRVFQAATTFLNGEQGIWPAAVTHRADKRVFDWDLLTDPNKQLGPDRLWSQYIRANVDPHERYTLSLVGSSRFRLGAHEAREFGNLYLAGDWTQTGLNIGCVEAAVISGLLAAHALSGYPRREDIVGLEF
jgi:uncharacterized protein with NAD-binding domain and iron-sulfur cluster